MPEKEYIERGQVLEIINRLSNEPYYQHNGETFYDGVSAVDLEILTIPTADVAEVKHGYWAYNENHGAHESPYLCSECLADGSSDIQGEKYCYNCGAEMSDRNGVVVEKENSVMCPICKSKRIFNLRIDNDWSYGTGIYYPANDEENYSDEELNYNATDRPDIDLYHCLNCDLLW